jgi:TM2 domain-containing membrane protein YozV
VRLDPSHRLPEIGAHRYQNALDQLDQLYNERSGEVLRRIVATGLLLAGDARRMAYPRFVRFLAASLLAVIVVAAPLAARAQQPPPVPYDPYAPQPAYGAPPPYAAPPGYGAPAYGAPYGNPYGAPTPMQLMMYENEKKSAGLALVLQILLPGAGSIYADHVAGAVLTWGGMIGGIALIVVGVNQDVRSIDGQSMTSGRGDGLIVAGIAAYLGFWIYGFVDAYQSANEYNVNLAKRLRLPMMDLSVAPLRTATQSTALAPTLTWRF